MLNIELKLAYSFASAASTVMAAGAYVSRTKFFTKSRIGIDCPPTFTVITRPVPKVASRKRASQLRTLSTLK